MRPRVRRPLAQELHDINEFRLQTLESLMAEKEKELTDAKARTTKLKEDFSYNLRLLEERDAEVSPPERCATPETAPPRKAHPRVRVCSACA